ncbi:MULTISPECIES: cation:proton antiporter [Dietzia]|uniref:Monovalent cation/H(+) antiporter subunit G n=1 Tax=Dietzia cinnamea TaxID=321318 RepID=A0AAW5Q8F2_9ACTN|nr:MULTISPECIES: monovalent cation/H(+) antiporter subunit G [Dietzia]KZO58943.1 Na+/H+ antiporter subunit G [Dietzia maris]AVM64415.1 Na+/H+ antiporter subunit G [Dietzia sp. oral taxon 368]MBM7230090.1 monovalent cation/H(+) antiporter subunit G [Dietzia cinnamea]MCT1639778.1 monovalent cation/H(+) antiporter subunit G [Dietzia cinnamea]MCT1712242.1 monovalent cation/H(+) antiporter subunit G [Dietzia cinnamea]
MTDTLHVARDVAVILSAAAGLLFFTAGTVGLLRFPDLRSRLHAVTKADTLGLGFVMLALALASDSLWAAAAFLLVWVLGMGAAAVGATLLGSDREASP